ncbi:MAG: phosphotransferase enzyme family protein [Cyclobacteriaceae bacterium]|nr:phosphotransferase enzyme family protein [Cyclobacteriaceae bacterium]
MTEKENLHHIFERWSGEKVEQVHTIPQSGSYREYYRLVGSSKTAIGVFNEDLKENKAFLSFTKHFSKLGLAVPQLLAEDDGGKTYLLSDLGDEALFDYLQRKRNQVGVFPGTGIKAYKEALNELPKFQILAGQHLDYSVCYPRPAFDRQSMVWDLSYFKYYFLKLAKIPFDEQMLEDDFSRFIDYLLQADSNYFLYRDFQSKNIMMVEGKPFFIDYQGGRKGALQYDVASLLYDSKANIPGDIKDILLDHYLDVLRHYLDFDKKEWVAFYRAFVLIRLMQAMGAYGFRGFYERKTQFLKSIPYALKQLDNIINSNLFPPGFPYMEHVLSNLTSSKQLLRYRQEFNTLVPLNIELMSFSYHKGLPVEKYGHGGGFIFDCRGIHNPGRYERFSSKNGKDGEVMDFLKTGGEADEFLNNAIHLVEQTIDKYLNREFKHLQIAFGCTGGQHRSVYCAEKMAEILNDKYEDRINIRLSHRELDPLAG